MRQAIKALLLWLLLIGHAFAFAPIDGCGNNAATPAVSTLSCTLGGTVAIGNSVFGEVSWATGGGQTISSIQDDKGNSYNIVDTLSDGTFQISTFYKTNIRNSPQTITVTWSFANTFVLLATTVYTFSGTLDGHAIATQVNPSGTDTVTSGSFSATPGDLVIAYAGNGGTDSTLALGTGYTFTQQISPSGNDFVFGAVKTAAASSVAATWTPSRNDSWVTGGMAFLPLPANGLLIMGCCQ